MGIGNVCTFGKYEGLYYVDYSNFYCYNDLTDKEAGRDYEMENVLIQDAISNLSLNFLKLFPSFTLCNVWINKNQRAILENGLFYIVTADNEWSIAIMLIQKDQDCYSGSLENLQKKHGKNYLSALATCLFNQFNELGVYAGSWTSGTIKRPI